MAPSPTGLLHIGNVRTALFNWLFARHEGGEFRLRIENTDTAREVYEATEQIQESLRWLGLDWDGEVTFQLDRMDETRAVGERLVAEGAAYLDDGAIRFRMPDDGVTEFDDAVLGHVQVPNVELEDLVLIRSDGRPTYNFASPLEDFWDGITHVIRGPDHISNTPKQIHVLRAVGAEPPVYAHVPNVNGADGGKLSKRHGAVSVDDFRAAGYVPEALMNFLALLGWAPDGETTIMSRDDLVERFSLERVGSSPATFDYAKLDWMNGVYLRELPPDEYAARLVAYLREQGSDWPEERIRGGGAARAGEDRPLRRVLGVRRVPLRGRRAGSDPPRRAHPSRYRRCAQRDRDVVGRGHRGVVEAPLRRAGGEAAGGVSADSRGCHGLEGVAGPLREPGAPGTRRSARQAPGGRGDGARVSDVTALSALVGTDLGPTSWLEVSQGRIDLFAEATDDPQWIHTDPGRAAEGPFGTTIAHGFLTLSLCVPMLSEVLPRSSAMVVNYGVNRVRFPAAVPSGGRVRGRFRVLSVEEASRGERVTIDAQHRVRRRREAGLRGRARPLDSVLTSSGGVGQVWYRALAA